MFIRRPRRGKVCRRCSQESVSATLSPGSRRPPGTTWNVSSLSRTTNTDSPRSTTARTEVTYRSFGLSDDKK
ncbi:MAG: hypothetical protein KDD72_12535 [Anaerolineales bacterium]|nr:hypothetical protein [Anaerolineales bacterium]